jgi:hypothetical protein
MSTSVEIYEIHFLPSPKMNGSVYKVPNRRERIYSAMDNFRTLPLFCISIITMGFVTYLCFSTLAVPARSTCKFYDKVQIFLFRSTVKRLSEAFYQKKKIVLKYKQILKFWTVVTASDTWISSCIIWVRIIMGVYPSFFPVLLFPVNVEILPLVNPRPRGPTNYIWDSQLRKFIVIREGKGA